MSWQVESVTGIGISCTKWSVVGLIFLITKWCAKAALNQVTPTPHNYRKLKTVCKRILCCLVECYCSATLCLQQDSD